MWNMRGLLALLPSGIAELLQRVPPEILNRMTELRLRAGQPPAVTVGARTLFLSSEGTTVTAEKGLLIPQETVQETLLSLCGHSLHGIEKTLDQGYFTAAGGFRVGVCMLPDAGRQGLALSLCIRLPRELPGAAREVYPVWRKSSGIILAGPPASGKTTVLRDLCRMISAGVQDGPCRTVLIDERNELSGWDGKRAAFRLGPCTDILFGIPKEQALRRAIRTLSPQVILCDEIADGREAAAIREGFYCGVKFAVTVHCGSRQEMGGNVIMRELMRTGAFSHIHLLGLPAGTKGATVTKDEFDREDNRAHYRVWGMRGDRDGLFGQAAPEPAAGGADGAVLGGFPAADGTDRCPTGIDSKDAGGTLGLSGVSLCPMSCGMSGGFRERIEGGGTGERFDTGDAESHSAADRDTGQHPDGNGTAGAIGGAGGGTAGGKILGGTGEPAGDALPETGGTGRTGAGCSADVTEETAWKWISSSG